MGWIGEAWGLFRRVEGVLEAQRLQGELIKDLSAKIASLDQRVTALEYGGATLLTEARSAARAGAGDAMHGVIAGIVSRVAALEVARELAPKKPPVARGPQKPKGGAQPLT